jgi:SAM-dependent methyltransferase
MGGRRPYHPIPLVSFTVHSAPVGDTDRPSMQTPDGIRAAYDAVAKEYAEHFADELAHKPRDRELLQRFADAVATEGIVYDLGCGPGQTTAFLHECGLRVHGLDLSPELVREARLRNPDVTFGVGDMLELPLPDASAAGVVAFYAIVHFSPTQLGVALREMHRVLAPGGLVLLAFHIGTEVKHVDGFLGHDGVSLDFNFFAPESVQSALERAGFGEIEVNEREPYPGVEYPSRRAYVFAVKR